MDQTIYIFILANLIIIKKMFNFTFSMNVQSFSFEIYKLLETTKVVTHLIMTLIERPPNSLISNSIEKGKTCDRRKNNGAKFMVH